MTFDDGVPPWARRRAERHRARHKDGKVVRWMTFRADHRRMTAEGSLDDAGGNVVRFVRRPPPDAAPPLDATGS